MSATNTTIRAASGQLPPAGGEVDAALVSGDIPSEATGGVAALAAGTLHSSVVGLDMTNAEASLAAVSLTISGNQITTDFLMARSSASCPAGPAITGGSELANLVINGQVITVTGEPNQTVTLPNGVAVINEQVPAVAGSIGQLMVNALRVTTFDPVTGQPIADAVLAQADALIDCQPGAGPAGGFATGGGWIPPPTNGKGTFGVVGGVGPDGMFAGHVVYIDHDINRTLRSTSIVGFTPGCTTSVIDARDDTKSPPETFQVTVTDAGEPGTSDQFMIQVIAGAPYSASGTLGGGTGGGGNIQLHRPPCP